MSGEKNLSRLIKGLHPTLNTGEYVFVSVENTDSINSFSIVCEFMEPEGITVILEKEEADKQNFEYQFVAAWITLKVHSSLEAVGLTAHFSNALAVQHISCNVVAGFYHDHIFVAKQDAEKAMQILTSLSETS